MFARLLICFAVLAFASPALAAKRIALLIGNQDYRRGVGKLVNPLNDIKLVGDALRKVGFEVLTPVENATRVEILDALDRYTGKLQDAGSDAIGFIYYSGHGIASRGTNYLIPVNVEEPSTRLLRAVGVRQSEILSLLRSEAPNAAHYLVIDACRNELQGARGAKGFVAVNQQSGTLIAYATAPGKTASDQGNGGGPYAKALAAEIVKPGVSDLHMFHEIRVAVAKATNGDQVPWTIDGIRRDQRVMFGGSKTLPSKPQPPLSEAARAWQIVQNTQNAAALRAFARRYKGTVFADMALAMAETPERRPPNSRKTTRPPLHDCDRFAAINNALDPITDGVAFDAIDPEKSIPACRAAVAAYPESTRFAVQLGRSLHKAGIYHEALRLYRRTADKGNATAMYNIGAMNAHGFGVTKDYVKALRWYRRAEDKGYTPAKYAIGVMYRNGFGVTKDYGEALRWYREAAEKGDADAMNSIGVMYEAGYGVSKNYGEALHWYREAADNGNTRAINNVGRIYKDGLGVSKDYAKALRWYRKSADKGDTTAMNNIGVMYLEGNGVTKKLWRSPPLVPPGGGQGRRDRDEQHRSNVRRRQIFEEEQRSGRRVGVQGTQGTRRVCS